MNQIRNILFKKNTVIWLLLGLFSLGNVKVIWAQKNDLADSSQVLEFIKKSKDLLNSNELEMALSDAKIAEDLAKKISWHPGLLKAYSIKSSIQNISNQHYEAISTGVKGLTLAKELGDKYYEIAFYRSLANNHDMLDNYSAAIPYYEKCLSVSENFDKAELIRGHCFVELGDAYRLHLKQPQKAKELIESGLAIYNKKDPSSTGYAYDYLGEVLTDLKMYKEAEETFKKSRIEFEKYEDHYLIPELLFHTANLYLAQKKYDIAISFAKEGLAYSQKMKTIYGESEANKTLYEAYKATNNSSLALAHFERYTVLKDSMNQANVNNHFKQIESDVRLQKQESQIKELELSQQKSQLKSQRQLLYGLVSLLLITGLFGFYFSRLNKKLKEKNSKISEALLLGQAIERRRVATDLHDDIGANLTSINWALDLIKTDSLSQNENLTFENIRKQLTNTYNQVTLLAQNIVPEELEKLGLRNALKNLVRKKNESLQIKHTLALDENLKPMNAKIEFELYYICLELMNQGKNRNWGELSLEISGHQLQVKYRSDGGKSALADETGVRNIALRAEILNGKLKREIDSEGIQTCSIRIDLPKSAFN